MQTSTSISDLKKTKKQSTDDLVNDILKELQTTPALLPSKTPCMTTSIMNDLSSVPTTVSSSEETTSHKNTSLLEHPVIQYMRLPIVSLAVYFILHNTFVNRLLLDYAPEIFKIETSFMNKLLKSLVLAATISITNHFALSS